MAMLAEEHLVLVVNLAILAPNLVRLVNGDQIASHDRRLIGVRRHRRKEVSGHDFIVRHDDDMAELV